MVFRFNTKHPFVWPEQKGSQKGILSTQGSWQDMDAVLCAQRQKVSNYISVTCSSV